MGLVLLSSFTVRTLPVLVKAAGSFLEKYLLTSMVDSSDLSRWSLGVVVGDVALTNHSISVDESEGVMGITYN